MFHLFAPHLETLWGPFRLLGSHLVLMSFGALVAGGLSWLVIWRWRDYLPRDRGREHAPEAQAAMRFLLLQTFLTPILLIPLLKVR